MKPFQDAEQLLNYSFKNIKLLQEAFTHKSYRHEQPLESPKDNERLEFLGDAVLELIISQWLYEKFPDKEEGDLTSIRAQLVDAKSCAFYIENLKVEKYLLLGKGEIITQKRHKKSLNANLFEAILGAIFNDSGYLASKLFIEEKIIPLMLEILKNPRINWKAKLQEWSQKKNLGTPSYKLIEEKGPSHQKKFLTNAVIDENEISSGEGYSKKEAEQQAAEIAYKKLTNEND